MIKAIGSDQDNNWFRKKLLERQSQQLTQNQLPQTNPPQNVQPQEQVNGPNQVQTSEKVASLQLPAKIEAPWSGFMTSLGLNSQGSKEADISAIGEKIAQMRTQAKDPAQKAQIDSLEKQYNGYKMVAANMQAPPPPPQNQVSSVSPDQKVGATQIGDINRLMLVKKRQPEETHS